VDRRSGDRVFVGRIFFSDAKRGSAAVQRGTAISAVYGQSELNLRFACACGRKTTVLFGAELSLPARGMRSAKGVKGELLATIADEKPPGN